MLLGITTYDVPLTVVDIGVSDRQTTVRGDAMYTAAMLGAGIGRPDSGLSIERGIRITSVISVKSKHIKSQKLATYLLTLCDATANTATMELARETRRNGGCAALPRNTALATSMGTAVARYATSYRLIPAVVR